MAQILSRPAVLKPDHLPHFARAVMAVGSLCAAALMLLPMFQGAEEHLGLTDKQAHALAFYIFTLCAFMALPRMRRSDLALAALGLGAAAEVAQLATGRSASFLDLSADAVGIFFAWAPSQIEQLRTMARQYPGMTFRQIRALDRRQGARAAEPDANAAPDRSSVA